MCRSVHYSSPEHEITTGHRTISEQIKVLSEQNWRGKDASSESIIMSNNNRVRERPLLIDAHARASINVRVRDRVSCSCTNVTYSLLWQLVMSKRTHQSPPSSGEAKRRKVKHATYKGWLTQYDREKFAIRSRIIFSKIFIVRSK